MSVGRKLLAYGGVVVAAGLTWSARADAWRQRQPQQSNGSALVFGGELEEQLATTFTGCPLLKKLEGGSLIHEDLVNWSLPATVAPAPPPRRLLQEWVLGLPPTRLVIGMGGIYSTPLEGKILRAMSDKAATPTLYSSRDAVFDVDARFVHEESCATLASVFNKTGAKFGVDAGLEIECQAKTKSSLSVAVGTLQNQLLADIAAANADWERGRRAYEELWRLHAEVAPPMYVIDDVQAVFLVAHRLATSTFRSNISVNGSWSIGVVGSKTAAAAQVRTTGNTTSEVSRAFVFAAKTADGSDIPSPDRFRVKPLPSKSAVATVLASHLEAALRSQETPDADVPVFEWDASASYQVLEPQLLYKGKVGNSDARLHLGRHICEQSWQAQVLTAESMPLSGVAVTVQSAKVVDSDDCKLIVHVSGLPAAWKDGPAQELRLRIVSAGASELKVENPFRVLVRAQHVAWVSGPTCVSVGSEWRCTAPGHILRHDQKPIDHARTVAVHSVANDLECSTLDADGKVTKSSAGIVVTPLLNPTVGSFQFHISPSQLPAGTAPPWERCTLKSWAVRVFPKDKQLPDSLVHMVPMNFDKPR